MGTNAEYIGGGFLALKDTNSNAYQCGVLQGLTFESSSDIKELIGNKKVAILTAEVGRKYKLSAKFAQLSGPLVGAVMGGVRTTGSKFVSTVRKTVSTGAASVALTDDGSPAGWAFVEDLGVTFGATGQPLRYNSGTVAAGEYKNSGASYTFHTDDNAKTVDISYVWSQTAGTTYTVSNSAIGLSTYFAVTAAQSTTQADGTVRKLYWKFPAVLIPSLKIPFSNTDFTVQDMELSVFADSSDVIAYVTAV